MFSIRQVNRAIEWSELNKNYEEENAHIFWSGLFSKERELLLELSGYKSKYVDFSFDELTPELKDMIKYVVR